MRKKMCLAAAMPMLFWVPAEGQVATWIGPAQGSWSTPANWSGGSVPDVSTTVHIDGGAAQNSSVFIDIPSTARSIIVSAGDTAVLGPQRTLVMAPIGAIGGNPTISGPGIFQLGTAEGNAEVSAVPSVLFSGEGTMILVGRSRYVGNAVLTQDQYNVVGTGRLTTGAHIVGGNSLLEARADSGNTGTLATLNVVTAAMANSGLLAAAAGSTLELQTRRLDSTGSQGFSTGTVHAAPGGTILFTDDTVIVRQRFTGGAGGFIHARATEDLNSISLSSVENHVTFLSDRSSNTIIGDLPNSQTMTFAAAGGSLQFSSATATLSGGGMLRLNDLSVPGSGTATLTNIGHTLAGSTGAGSLSTGTLINGVGGLILADVPAKRFTLAPAVQLTNSGTLAARNGGELLLGGATPFVDNRFGRITATGPGSRVLIDHTTRVFGGLFETDADGEIVFDAPTGTLTSDNVTNLGRLRVQSGTLSSGAAGFLINSGTITTGDVALDGTTSFAGTGQVVLGGRISEGRLVNLGNRISGTGRIDTLENRAGGIVDAAGSSIEIDSVRANNGLLRASNSGTLTTFIIDNTGGRIEAAESTVRINGAVNTGTLAALAAGTIQPVSSSVPFGNGATLFGPGTYGSSGGASPLSFRFQLNHGESFTAGDNPVFDRNTFTIAGATSINLAGTNRAVTLKDPTINSGAATLNIANGTLNLQGLVTNRANIHLRPSGSGEQSSLIPTVGTVTLTGSGTIHGASGSGGSGRLVNLDNTIHLGAASFGNFGGGLENYGTIRGGSGSSTLVVRADSTSVNRGLISSGMSEAFDLTGSATGTSPATLDNAGGIVAAEPGSTITLRRITINGGVIDSGGGTITFLGAQPTQQVTLRDVTFKGQGFVLAGGSLILSSFNTFSQGARLTVGDPSLGGGILGVSATNLAGEGELQLFPNGLILGGGLTLNGVDVVGAGSIGAGNEVLSVEPNSSVISRVVLGVAGGDVTNLKLFRLVLQGAFVVEPGSRMNLLDAQSLSLVSTGSIDIHAGGVFSSENSFSGGQVFNDGTLLVTKRNFSVDQIDGDGEARVIAGSLNADRLRQTSLSVVGTSRALVGASGATSRVHRLLIEPNAQLHLRRGALVIDYDTDSPIEAVRSLVASGYAAGSLNGTGIIANNSQGRRTGVGFAEASAVGLADSEFLGEPVDSTAVLLRYTLFGDADLTGTVTLSDFTRLAASFGAASTWSSGDFNYDGVTNLNDFTALAANFGTTLPADLPRGAAVPEPAGAGLLIGLTTLLARRERVG